MWGSGLRHGKVIRTSETELDQKVEDRRLIKARRDKDGYRTWPARAVPGRLDQKLSWHHEANWIKSKAFTEFAYVYEIYTFTNSILFPLKDCLPRLGGGGGIGSNNSYWRLMRPLRCFFPPFLGIPSQEMQAGFSISSTTELNLPSMYTQFCNDWPHTIINLEIVAARAHD
jgi:hypothetical protein